jgi:hypothetical protein
MIFSNSSVLAGRKLTKAAGLRSDKLSFTIVLSFAERTTFLAIDFLQVLD